MSLSTIIKMQTAFTTIEHQTGSRELAAMFDLFLIEGEDQRKLIFVGDNKKHVEIVRLALGSYAGAYPKNNVLVCMYNLLKSEIERHNECCAMAEEKRVATFIDTGGPFPKFDLVVEVTLTT